MYKLRDYQIQAVETGAHFLLGNERKNGIEVLPTGSGKSLIIANLCLRLGVPVLIFQPSKEILEQNYKKLASYGMIECSIFSASLNRKQISRVTFATIGSVVRYAEHFKGMFKYIIIDECHLVKPDDGMYKKVISTLGCKVLGLTATPYRLYSSSYGSQLRFITRTRPRTFNQLVYQVPIKTLVERGYLAKMRYFSMDLIRPEDLEANSTGADYTDRSIKREYRRNSFEGRLVEIIKRLVVAGRKRILVFTKFTDEAERVAKAMGSRGAYVSGETPRRERELILRSFQTQNLWVLCNVGVLTTGFDYPELDTIVMARPTRSLALWYQIVGRALRPSRNKEGLVVDCCGTYRKFGAVEDLEIFDQTGFGQYEVYNGPRQLTNVYYN